MTAKPPPSPEPASAPAAAGCAGVFWHLRLRPGAQGRPHWQADAAGPDGEHHFDSIPELVSWLTRLDAIGRPRHGIR